MLQVQLVILHWIYEGIGTNKTKTVQYWVSMVIRTSNILISLWQTRLRDPMNPKRPNNNNNYTNTDKYLKKIQFQTVNKIITWFTN